jgi:hypothetical protein
MSHALAVLGVAVLVALLLLALRARRRRRSRRPETAALPGGWLDLGVFPVPHARRRPLPRMLAAYLDPAATHFANAVRHARTRLVLDAVPHGQGVVLIDAGTCAADAPWVASNLALGLSQLGPVLLVHGIATPALDDNDPGAAAPVQDAGDVRTWRPGMIDLLRCEPGALLEVAAFGRWRDRYEWIVVDGECAARMAGAGPPEGVVCVSLYAGAGQLRELVEGVVADIGPGTCTRAVLGIVES